VKEAPTIKGGKRDSAPPNKPVSVRQQAFVSLFTPQWTLGLLLFVGMFLPSYRGCNDSVITPCTVLALPGPPPGEPLSTWPALLASCAWYAWLVTWPFFFGLVLALATWYLAWSRRERAAFGLWWWYCGFVLFNTLVWQLAALAGLGAILHAWFHGDLTPTLPTMREALGGIVALFQTPFGWSLLASVVLLAAIPIMARVCRNWYRAAMLLQISLVLLAAVSVSTLTPGLLLAKDFLAGGKLSVACAVLLIPVSIAVWADGQRVLVRRKGESPLRLSLRTAMLLMLVGGLGCAWIASVALSDLALASSSP